VNTVICSEEEIKVTVERCGAMGPEVHVDYRCEDGTVVANVNYTPLNGTLVFRPDR